MRKQYRIVKNAAVVAMSLLVAGRALAGSLDPTNAPGPTMHTLEEIYQRVFLIPAYPAAVPKTGQTSSYATDDDGALKKGAAWPNPRFTAGTGVDGTNCVTDNLTGLIWARNANMFGNVNWGAAVTNCNNLTYGGQTDWRLPNIKELQSLIDFGQYTPALPSGHPFAGVQSDNYWSSSTFAPSADIAWYVFMNYGIVASYFINKTTSCYVWPVRGGQ